MCHLSLLRSGRRDEEGNGSSEVSPGLTLVRGFCLALHGVPDVFIISLGST